MRRLTLLGLALSVTILNAQTPQPDWTGVEEETMRHFQALLRSTRAIRRVAR